MKLDYPPGATPIDADEAAGLIPSHLTLQRELNEFEEANILLATEWLLARRRPVALHRSTAVRGRG